LISVYFIRQGFVFAQALPETERFNSAFSIEIILPSPVQFVSLPARQCKLKSYWLHIANAALDNSAVFLYKIEELGFTRLPQLSYFPDLAPDGFLLFGHLKKEL
jgi:hypothetical protein